MSARSRWSRHLKGRRLQSNEDNVNTNDSTNTGGREDVTSERPWFVMKYGGTSVGDPSNWPTIEHTVRANIAEGRRPFVVCSALAGVSNQLDALISRADAGELIDDGIDAIRERHERFAREMGIEATSIVDDACGRLHQLLQLEEPSPQLPVPVRAEVMAIGELLSTRLGARWLEQRGLSVSWRDARDMLRACDMPEGASDEQRYLLASCTFDRDQELEQKLSTLAPDAVVITQGFIATNDRDETVLLGRGGSDTAAAYFASKLNASRLEIWTDVPGMFTTNPNDIPSARLLMSLSYDEAETLAGMGAKVLHPHCIHPVRKAGIPLYIKWIKRPEVKGTVIEAALTDHANGVKAVSARKSLTLISMDKRAGWQPVGFMADVSSRFKERAIPIDLLASSSSNIRATIDVSTAPELGEKIPDLIKDLKEVCRPSMHEDVASVCLVGHEIRGTIHELAPTLELLREQRLLMLTQAANDLTFTFVVPSHEMDELVRTLHAELFECSLDDEHFGPTWTELQKEGAQGNPAAAPGPISMSI